MNAAKFSQEIVVRDPDTHAEVHLSVYKHENGGMFAIDSSFVEQLPPAYKNDDIRCVAMDPLSDPLSEFKTDNFVVLEEE